MTTTEDKVYLFTRDEYRQMFDSGMFADKRVELLDGRILEMAPQNEPHMNTISNLIEFLTDHLPRATYRLRCQGSVATDEYSEPEPDFAVIHRTARPSKKRPALVPILVIEVSDTTLARDRRKAATYAAAGVQEYWIVNLPARTVEQYTRPHGGSDAGYAHRTLIEDDGAVQCTVLPLPALAVKDCLASI